MILKPSLAALSAALVLAAVASPGLAQMPPPPPAPPFAAQPRQVMLLAPVAVDKMQADNVVALKGSVAEIFGNKFILQDDSGRALIELGPQGEDGNVVAKGEQVTVQGRFEHGFVVAELVAHADGRARAFGPPGPPPPPPPDQRGPGRRPPPPPR